MTSNSGAETIIKGIEAIQRAFRGLRPSGEDIKDNIFGSFCSAQSRDASAPSRTVAINPTIHKEPSIPGNATVQIDFQQRDDFDNWQPEAARLMSDVMCFAARQCSLHEKPFERREARPNRINGAYTDRRKDFFVPGQSVNAFARCLQDIAASIRHHGPLVQQYDNTIRLALSCNAIPGLKPYPGITLEAGIDEDAASPTVRPPRMKLKLENVPVPLARTLASQTGQDFEALIKGPETHSRDMSKDFPGNGRTIELDMSASYVPAVEAEIRRYAQYQSNRGIQY